MKARAKAGFNVPARPIASSGFIRSARGKFMLQSPPTTARVSGPIDDPQLGGRRAWRPRVSASERLLYVPWYQCDIYRKRISFRISVRVPDCSKRLWRRLPPSLVQRASSPVKYGAAQKHRNRRGSKRVVLSPSSEPKRIRFGSSVEVCCDAKS